MMTTIAATFLALATPSTIAGQETPALTTRQADPRAAELIALPAEVALDGRDWLEAGRARLLEKVGAELR